jgi:hypothetical protein
MYDEGSPYPARAHRHGHRHGGRGGYGGGRGYGRDRGAGFRAGAYDDPTAENSDVLRQAVRATVAAARQVALDGDPNRSAKAAELLNEARKGLYRLLAGEAE